MGQKGFISDADKALANLIWNSLQNESAAEKIISSQEQISFSSPKNASIRGNRKLSIFLYNITEESVLKNVPPQGDDTSKLVFGVPFALHYLVTPFTGNEKDDHALLEIIIQMFLANPLIDVVDAGNTVEASVKIDSLSLDELTRLWLALDTPLRLSVSLTISSAEPLQHLQTQTTDAPVALKNLSLGTNHVTQIYQAVLKTFTEQSTGWRNRNMVVKQWVLQDFQKNSGMTVEEMQNMLNSLEGKMGHGESTEQFIKPLNQLAGYYQHQLDELKGLHKISHKQTENIEAITSWIKDIKSLVEALSS